jgi:hypothetical protein
MEAKQEKKKINPVRGQRVLTKTQRKQTSNGVKPKSNEKEKPFFAKAPAGKPSSAKVKKSEEKQIKVVLKKEKKKKIRRSGLEIRKAKKEEEEEEWTKEPEWEIPAFLRRKAK